MKKQRFLGMIVFVLFAASLACNLPIGRKDDPTESPVQIEVEQPTEAVSASERDETSTAELSDAFRSEEGGYSFRAIPAWVVEEVAGFATMIAPDGNDDSGPMIALFGMVEDMDMTLDAFYEVMIVEYAPPGGNITAGTPTDTTVGDAPARTVEISGTSEEGGVPIAGRITMAVYSPSQAFVILGFAPTERWESELSTLFNAVQNSVVFFEAVPSSEGVEPQPEEDEATLEEIRQWAVSAVASTEYSNPDWSAMQATGAPDTHPNCGDEKTAWASSDSNGVDWLELSYDTPVIPTEINIYETYSPGQIVKVEVMDANGTYHQVYTAQPEDKQCPNILTIPVSDVDHEVVGVKLSLDQSVLEMYWNEIDAVELVGLAAAGASVSEAEEADTETETDEQADFETPAGLLWQAGGESGFNLDQLGVPDGMDVDSNGFLYVADRSHGVWYFNEDGTFPDLLESDTFNNPTDVEVSTQGGGYIAVASWGSNNVSVFDFNGNLLTSFGSEGTGPGQFGNFSPQDLTLDLDNNIYVLDNNQDANEEDFDRVEVFDIEGNFLYEWTIDEDFFSAVAIKYWAGPTPEEDRIYVLGFVGGYLLEYDLQGNLIGKVGEDALGFSGPQDVDLDQDGNFYVVTWTPAGVMKLDHDGNMLAQWGVEVEDDANGLPPGGFTDPTGVAVQPDGSAVYVSDWTGDYAYVTAFSTK